MEQFTLNAHVSGFRITRIQEIEELKGTGYEMLHEKSGARLYYLKTDDDNKVFSVTFRTPPYDSTGLPHILEHSVLCGSKKYPLKDPFVELAKGSMNTFLNAMTFSDKTMYPVASRNEQDLMNLMDVYLNAVFYPNLLEQPQILQQEGWHYEINSPEELLRIKGVVYNEMKGAFSSPEQVMFRKIQETLFPDTPYGFESGGDPEFIPKLTQEKFTEFHRTYYHPSNAFIYLYGNGDIHHQLAFIDREYLSQFEKQDIDSTIPLQKPFDAIDKLTITYPVGPEESTEEKTYLSLNYVTGTSVDPEHHLAMEMLNYLLLGTSAAPLKKALIKAELGKDVFGSFDSSIQQPVFSVIAKNSEEAKASEFQTIVESTLRELVDHGIDKKLIESVINIHEFKLREADYGRYPRGLVYCMKMMESWLYESDPSMHLSYETTLKKIKSSLTTPYFEMLIEKMLLNNPHSNLLVIKPQAGLNEEREAQLARLLEARKDNMSHEELEALIASNILLADWQNTPHTEEELEAIPILTIDDLDEEPETIPIEIEQHQEFKMLKHAMFTNQIQYAAFYFDIGHLEQNEMHYAGLITSLLGKISTNRYDYESLSNELNLHTGGIHFHTDVFPVKQKMDENQYRFVVRGKSLVSKNESFWHLMDEIMLGTKWNDRKRIREVVREIKSHMEMGILQQGHSIAARRALSYFSPSAAFQEQTGGIAFYHFIADLEQHYDDKINEVMEKLDAVMKKMLLPEDCVISYTGEREHYQAFADKAAALMRKIPKTTKPSGRAANVRLNKGNEALYMSSKVQYVAKASNFMKFGFNYSGSMQVLKTICSLDYLWKRIRVSGGAYGAMAGFSRNGNTYFVSYRDPNLEETLQAYDELPDYLVNFNVGDREMTKYIIGTMSRMDAPLSPSMKGDKSDALYLTGITHEDEKRERAEIIHTTTETIAEYSEMIRLLMAENIYCVIGNESKLKQAENLFDRLLQIIR